MSGLLRKLHIDLITDTPNPLFGWFNDLCSTLFVIELNIYHKSGEYVYYIKDGEKYKIVFYLDNINNKLRCKHDLYWLHLVKYYKCDNSINDEVPAITNFLMTNFMPGSNVTIINAAPIFNSNTFTCTITKNERIFIERRLKIALSR